MSPELSYLCPDCRSLVDAGTLACPNGHRFEEEDGVLVLVGASLLARLRPFIEVLEEFRSGLGRRVLDETAYDALPQGEARKGDFEWRLRCYDLSIVRPLLRQRAPGSVLDIGSHNGWLARHLSDDGHQVTAIDYFDDPYDGLRARKFYRRAEWRSVQMDLRDLSVLNRTYEVVILNRCLQFFPDPLDTLSQATERVAPGGLLVLTGLDFYRDPRARQAHLDELQRQHWERYGTDFFLHPTRGYLDFGDREQLRARGVLVRPYARHWHRNLRSRLVPTRAWFGYGVWSKSVR